MKARHGELRTSFGAYVLDATDAAEILADAIGDPRVQGQVYNTFDRWLDLATTAPALSRLLGREVRVACPPAREPRSPLRAERLHARYDRFRTDERLGELLAVLARRALERVAATGAAR